MDIYGKTDNSILRDIGIKIRETRLEQNMTQKELQERSGVSIRRISDIEKGSNYTTLSLIALLRALALLDYLSSFFEEKKISPLEYAKLMDSNRNRQRATSYKDDDDIYEENLGW